MSGNPTSPYVRNEVAVKIFGTTGLRFWGVTVLTLSLTAGLGVLGLAHIERGVAGNETIARASGIELAAAGVRPDNQAAFWRLPFNEASVPVDSNLQGKGVRVGSAFHVLTSRHVVNACPRLVVIDADGLPHHAVPVAEDRNNDMALIAAETLPPSPGISVRGFPPPAFNETIWHVRPATFRQQQDETIVGTARIADLSRRDDSRLVTLISDERGDGPAFLGGDSGGPVTDTDGRLVGIITGTLPTSRAQATEFAQNIGFMTNVGLIELFLHDNGIDYRDDHDEPDDPPRRPDDILQHAVEVHCDRQGRIG